MWKEWGEKKRGELSSTQGQKNKEEDKKGLAKNTNKNIIIFTPPRLSLTFFYPEVCSVSTARGGFFPVSFFF